MIIFIFWLVALLTYQLAYKPLGSHGDEENGSDGSRIAGGTGTGTGHGVLD